MTTPLVAAASAAASDLGQWEWPGRARQERGRGGHTSLADENKDVANHAPYSRCFYRLSSGLLEGQRSSRRCGPLLRVIGCHEDEYFARPVLIKIDNCAELSSGDESC